MGDIYCIMNHKKVKCSDNIRGLQAEANREYEDESKYRNNVDLSRSNQNVTLVHSDDWRKSIYDAIAEAGLSANKDSVLAISTVYTASPEWFEAHPDRQEQIAYFKACLDFHEMRFGKVFNAKIHFDETTPHMQLVSVPILEVPKVENYWVCNADGKEVTPDDAERWGKKDVDRKRKQRKVLDENGKPIMQIGLNGGYALGGKAKLSRLQTEFAKKVGTLYGMERGECRIDTDEQVEHETALQHKVKELEQQVAEQQDEVEYLTDRKEGLKRTNTGFIASNTKLMKENEALKAENAQLKADAYADICQEIDETRYFAELELDERIAQEAHEAHKQLNANIGPRIRAVWEREQAEAHQKAEIQAQKDEYDKLTVELKNAINELENEKGKIPEADKYLKKVLEQQQIKLKSGKMVDGWTHYSNVTKSLRDADIRKMQEKAERHITAEQLVKNVELGIGFNFPESPDNSQEFGS